MEETITPIDTIALRIPLDIWAPAPMSPHLALGSDQAKPLLFQGLFARERCYLALESHFPYRNGRHKAAPALEEYTNRPPRQPGDVVL